MHSVRHDKLNSICKSTGNIDPNTYSSAWFQLRLSVPLADLFRLWAAGYFIGIINIFTLKGQYPNNKYVDKC